MAITLVRRKKGADMIDHIYVPVRDVTRSTEFYARALNLNRSAFPRSGY